MLSAVRSALKLIMSGENVSLAEAVWRVQNQLRHAGRRVPYYSVGSTLLVKGLEFANVVIVHSPNLSNKDWYVALTRATYRITILSPDRSIRPSG
jgi:DNA helicase-2/ATP-dependent DNA helicase PcrA